MPELSRRQFAATSITAGSLGAAAALESTSLSALAADRVAGANDRIRLGFIGVGNRGDQVLDGFLQHKDCEVVAVCDIFAPYTEFAAKKAGTNPKQTRDYREVLDRKDVDAVVIGTPDHWHALMAIEACAAGKDVYVEKPLGLVVREGRAICNAAERHRRVVQVGIHRRSSDFCKEAADFIRGGGIGKVTVVRAFHLQNEFPQGIGRPADGEPPEGFDWNAWLGPAPFKPYNKNRAFYRFRWFYDYSGGQVTNFGVHYVDMIQWALGQNAPLRVTALGGKFADYDNREVPDTIEVIWHYPGDTLVTFSQFNASGAPGAARGCEIEFRGTLGTLYVHGTGYEVVPEQITPNEFAARSPVDRSLERGWRTGAKAKIEPRSGKGHQETSAHARNFLDCVKTREKCHCDPETGHRSTSATQIANIAHRLGAVLQWDAEKEEFVGHDEANKMLAYNYRAPYKFPSA
jgi:predicted dehydrogenase